MRDLIRASKALQILTGLLLFFFSVSVAMSGGKGSESKGRFYFKQTCKTCHSKGAAGGEITPMSKTQTQWARYFEKGTHNKGTEKLTKFFTAEQLRDLEAFLYNHAVDSPQPETCGKN